MGFFPPFFSWVLNGEMVCLDIVNNGFLCIFSFWENYAFWEDLIWSFFSLFIYLFIYFVSFFCGGFQVSQLADSKSRRSCVCSIFPTASVLCLMFFIGSVLIGQDYSEVFIYIFLSFFAFLFFYFFWIFCVILCLLIYFTFGFCIIAFIYVS